MYCILYTGAINKQQIHIESCIYVTNADPSLLEARGGLAHALTFIMSCLTNSSRNARKERTSFWCGLGPSEKTTEWLLRVLKAFLTYEQLIQKARNGQKRTRG